MNYEFLIYFIYACTLYIFPIYLKYVYVHLRNYV